MVQSSLIVSNKGQCLRYKSDPTQPLDIYKFAMKCMDVSQRNGCADHKTGLPCYKDKQDHPARRANPHLVSTQTYMYSHIRTVALNTLCLYMYLYMYNKYVTYTSLLRTVLYIKVGMCNIAEAQIDSKSSIGLVALAGACRSSISGIHSLNKEWST